MTTTKTGSLSIEEWQHMLVICARLVKEFGESALPLFERCEREIAEAKSKSSAMDRARAIYDRNNPPPPEPTKPRGPRKPREP